MRRVPSALAACVPAPYSSVVREDQEALAAEVLSQAGDRHGGRDRYLATPCRRLSVEQLGGVIPWAKGLGRTFPQPRRLDVCPIERRMIAFDFPGPGQTSVYHDGRVGLDVGDGRHADVRGERHRTRFVGATKLARWRPEDALYFFGYALTHYLSLPFSLQDYELIEARRASHHTELWYRFPGELDTHSAVEGFFFDRSGLLFRHDYRADILGPIFHGAHHSDAYVDHDGLLLATRRTVYAKAWHYPVRVELPVAVLHASLRPAA